MLKNMVEKTGRPINEWVEIVKEKELAGNLDPDVAANFLIYPISTTMVEEWEKVN